MLEIIDKLLKGTAKIDIFLFKNFLRVLLRSIQFLYWYKHLYDVEKSYPYTLESV